MSVDYPDFGAKLAIALKQDSTGRGIAICGSGIGIYRVEPAGCAPHL